MAYEFDRRARRVVEDALAYARVVLLLGPRQAGKSTLLNELADRGAVDGVVSLDDDLSRRTALSDPTDFVAGLGPGVAIDEVQRAPDVLLAIKQVVDRDDRPGQYLLTGSANVLTAPRVLDALTGRTDIVTLWPLAESEVEGAPAGIVDRFFAGRPPTVDNSPIGAAAWIDRALAGGFPEARERPTGAPRGRWFEAYVQGVATRDLRELSDAHKLAEMPRLLRALAAQAAGILVPERLSQSIRLNAKTVQSYVRLLETVFMVQVLPAWRPGIAARERLAPKLLISDTGLLTHLIGADADRVSSDPRVKGSVFENFVAMELIKQLGWSDDPTTAHHYRRERREIDLILERRDGSIVAIEAKAGATLDAADRRALTELRDAVGERFRAGILLYTGAATTPLGDRLWAVPVSALWRG